MAVKLEIKKPSRKSVTGYSACYQGRTIATAKNFSVLLKNKSVKILLGKKGFIIKHTVPEGTLAIY